MSTYYSGYAGENQARKNLDSVARNTVAEEDGGVNQRFYLNTK